MGRKEDRKRNRALGINIQKMPRDPFEMSDGTLVFPVDSAEGGTANLGFLSPSEFFKTTAALSDREMNRLIYNQVKHAVEHGYSKD